LLENPHQAVVQPLRKTSGNPLEEKHSAEGDWLDRVSKSLKALKKLDGNPIIKNEEEDED